MLDTVHFQIFNPVEDIATGATRYCEFIEHVEKKASSVTSNFSYRNATGKTPVVIEDFILFDDKDGSPTLFHKDKPMKIPSSINHLHFAVKPNKQLIEINVSVPKFEAGNNVHYLLDFADFVEWSNNYAAVYKMVKFYIDKIIKSLADNHLHLKIDPKDVSVKEIDLCYNVLCQDNGEVTRRIMAAHQLDKSRQTDHTTTTLYADETFTVSSKLGWYFKVYNKGKEYERNGYNKLYAVDPAKADFILDQAQRICRYEMGIRTQYFDYLFWNKCYWKDSKSKPLYDKYLYQYHKPLNVGEKGYHEYKYYKDLFQPLTLKALTWHLGDHLKNPIWYKNEYDPAYGFRWQQGNIGFEKSFDAVIVKECFEAFTKMLNDYNPDFKNVKHEFQKYVTQSRIDNLVIDCLTNKEKPMSLDEIKRKFKITRATIFNIKKRFRERGAAVDGKTLHNVVDVYKPLSLMPYFHFKLLNAQMILPVYDLTQKKGDGIKRLSDRIVQDIETRRKKQRV